MTAWEESVWDLWGMFEEALYMDSKTWVNQTDDPKMTFKKAKRLLRKEAKKEVDFLANDR